MSMGRDELYHELQKARNEIIRLNTELAYRGVCGGEAEEERRGYANGYATAIETAAQLCEQSPTHTLAIVAAERIRSLKRDSLSYVEEGK